jgi:hypothetical protein
MNEVNARAQGSERRTRRNEVRREAVRSGGPARMGRAPLLNTKINKEWWRFAIDWLCFRTGSIDEEDWTVKEVLLG